MLRSILQSARTRPGMLAATSSLLLVAAGSSCAWGFSMDHRLLPTLPTTKTTTTLFPTQWQFSSSRHRQSNFEPWALRSYQTPADLYYQQHGEIPYPTIPHAVLECTTTTTTPKQTTNNGATTQSGKHEAGVRDTQRQGILLIGDVHGCYDELMDLHRQAVKVNNHQEFQYVILVGDLCNKGPYSRQVIQHCRTTDGWLAVRGNHDNAALSASLGDARRREKAKYQWVRDLTDEDITWMAELPYTLRIPPLVGTPGVLLDEEILVVHAGLDPGVELLKDQSIKTMTTIRTVAVKVNQDTTNPQDKELEVPWASQWQGKERVIFGHDAARGLQQYPKATGLDTGCVYGSALTGLILPQNKILSVPAKQEYSPVTR